MNAPEVILSPDTPLLTNAQDVAGAINELKKLSAEGGGDELWTPPNHWLEVPEPGLWEANFLIQATDNQSNFFYNIPSSAKKDALLIARLGSNIYVETLSGNCGLDTFRMCYYLKRVVIKSDSELPQNCFTYCYRLQRVDIGIKIVEVNLCFIAL